MVRVSFSVSIPDRYAKNSISQLFLLSAMVVSIPDRYAKNC